LDTIPRTTKNFGCLLGGVDGSKRIHSAKYSEGAILGFNRGIWVMVCSKMLMLLKDSRRPSYMGEGLISKKEGVDKGLAGLRNVCRPSRIYDEKAI